MLSDYHSFYCLESARFLARQLHSVSERTNLSTLNLAQAKNNDMESVENIILKHLKAMRGDIAGICEDMQEVKHRHSGLESGIGGLKRDAGDLYTENASQHVRYDRLAARIEKIERRLELN